MKKLNVNSHSQSHMTGCSMQHNTLESVTVTLNGETTTVVVNHLEDPIFHTDCGITLNVITKSGRALETPVDLLDVFQAIFGTSSVDIHAPNGIALSIWESLKESIIINNLDGGDFDSIEKSLKRLSGAIRHSHLDKDVKGELMKFIYKSLSTSGLRKFYSEFRKAQKSYLAE